MGREARMVPASREQSFDRILSRQIDATHFAIDILRHLPPSPWRVRRRRALRARLRMLEARIPT